MAHHRGEELPMLFMLVTRPKAGATREQMIEHLTRHLHPETWELAQVQLHRNRQRATRHNTTHAYL